MMLVLCRDIQKFGMNDFFLPAPFDLRLRSGYADQDREEFATSVKIPAIGNGKSDKVNCSEANPKGR